MFDYLKGEVVHVDTSGVAVLDVSGLGYKIYLTDKTALFLKTRVGEILICYVNLIVKETENSLYGFLTREERDCFNFLISLSGIGPKTGLSILNLLSLHELIDSVKRDDVKVIASVPGIGKKTAEKLMVDLKSKLPIIMKSMVYPEEIGFPVNATLNHSEEALQILIKLGYSKAGAERMIAQTVGTLSPDSDVSELLTAALRHRG